MTTPTALYFTDDQESNQLLAADPLALIIGLVLFQQVPVEKAFSGPLELQRRLGGSLDAAEIAAMDAEAIETVFRERPALHRFPAAMARRIQAVCVYLMDEYDGDPTAVWIDVDSADELLRSLKKLPGFGDYKATLTASILIERFNIRPSGWEDIGLEKGYPMLSEVAAPGDLGLYKDRKKAWKAAKKS